MGIADFKDKPNEKYSDHDCPHVFVRSSGARSSSPQVFVLHARFGRLISKANFSTRIEGHDTISAALTHFFEDKESSVQAVTGLFTLKKCFKTELFKLRVATLRWIAKGLNRGREMFQEHYQSIDKKTFLTIEKIRFK